jgi:hypothetical protein
LLNLSTDATWQTAITTFYQNTQVTLATSVLFTLPAGFNPSGFTGIANLQYTAPSGGSTQSILTYTGQLSSATQQQLLALTPSNATYVAAINYLYNQISAVIPGALPAIGFADANLSSITYNQDQTEGAIVFSGTPVTNNIDAFNLQQLSDDPDYLNAIGFIYSIPPIPPPCIGVVLPSLPAISLPAVSAGNQISWSNGVLSFTGQMQTSDYQTLMALSGDVGVFTRWSQYGESFGEWRRLLGAREHRYP